ncbi:TetR/AcrR family transcriptional regulator [Pontibacter anaerobius]|uniref:TetR/AcrR family transcriptional regulator n=1 Tax=Pontibacter anaerobius TaxID=2993940 RepID=A0ABT3RIV1_9BACT|nr:TetR/AcrR family transcriptional regulator [Pontibacter anaerobius]MCX2741788.1 TetR/AcrR family transcriptional regulator [Pontibacter anaerobius]
METPDNPRDRIIAEAKDLFFTHGYSKVLMADLAKRLGMSKKTLYQYFSGKEELLNVIIRKHAQDIQQEVESTLADNSLPFPDKTRRIFGFVGTKLHDINPEFVLDIKKNAPSAWQLLQKHKADAAFLRFNALLNEGYKKGYIRENVNRTMAVLLYASALETILNPDFTEQVPQGLMQELPKTPREVFDGLVKIIFKGILREDKEV